MTYNIRQEVTEKRNMENNIDKEPHKKLEKGAEKRSERLKAVIP